ncbi:DcaP family trimeric outer membrane transporter [Glaciecola siphonariae]|uniref:DcaP family trimeric outer membrane transporter n=1 Tax=Glaciecola siphonariae TaxID=521012 RepID=A0ABV9LX00_9ALTE
MTTKMTKTAQAISLCLCLGAASLTTQAATIGDTTVKFSGYIKADAIMTNYSDGTLASGNIGRDFYIPSLTPVGQNDEGTQFDAHIRQSRFRFTTSTPTDEGDTITGVLEFDMLATPNGDDRISNSYTPRIRHAFVSYKGWTVGQTWSTFMDVKVLPETVDFIGNTDGTIFERQPLVKYTTGSWEFALENPETTITPASGAGRITADDNALPDAIVRYTHSADWGHFAVAGLVRQLSYDDGVDVDESEVSYGVSLTSKIKLGKATDVRLAFNTGSGLGRYLALNAANGAVVTPNNELENIDSMAYAVSLHHKWNSSFRSNLTYSAFDADIDTTLLSEGSTEKTFSMRANLFYQPTAKITVGGEYAFARRELASGLDGDMNRLQFMLKYAF